MFWLAPLIAGAAQAGIGAVQGSAQEAESRRREKLNAELGSLDTAYSPFVKGSSTKVENTPMGPGALGGALTGGLSGFQTGMNISNAWKDAGLKSAPVSTVQVQPNMSSNIYTDLLKQKQQDPFGLLAPRMNA